ncbi:MAG: bifunctional hydroxymethylpyrimidine kinase/phosphomethylpyrimidine kinase [Epulopiscium sp. Nuni2H_MBin003]|nr:MAG: bifunctional hydroxymethylpyrimidine kinase/phosphomethylpyrimidine kinase [Epulopiscium sp. Nuni2H_MBin003]
MKKILTIAGSDCSGGAGIQADLKTISAHNLYGMSVITAITAQNTIGVSQILDVPTDMISAQIDAIFEDIRPDAVKIGMLSNINIIKIVVDKLKQYNATNIVVDPVMISTSGSKLLSDDAINMVISELIPLGMLITPNKLEAEVLCGFSVQNDEDMIKSANKILSLGAKNVLIKGGHIGELANDLLVTDNNSIWFKADRIKNPNTHGTGCTLSSAIACNLGKDLSLMDSVNNAKMYITKAIEYKLDLGSGQGPLWHNV